VREQVFTAISPANALARSVSCAPPPDAARAGQLETEAPRVPVRHGETTAPARHQIATAGRRIAAVETAHGRPGQSTRTKEHAMTFDIHGKTALVTGANRGIGKAIVQSLIDHGAAKVYAAVRSSDNAAQLVQAHGDRIVPIQIDLTRPETITAAARAAGDVDVVINNAGVAQPTTPLADNAIESLRYELDVNVFGLIRVAQAFAPVLKANGGGAFVQLNSVASLKSFPAFGTYAASKAAAYSITQALREMLAEQGTTVLSVHPGPIATDMAAQAGMLDVAEPASLVADGIIAALKAGEFHLFPDTMAKQVGEAYRGFAAEVIEGKLVEA
jgi:NAD(P)-dependent dehydrogenase (short-subunit alcohol dehydrogenase family)